ncbi:nucleoside hydrolase [Poriferisphaera sp. WC338]|uniref:nucleoside hydrolase n=1 Tax=Poriferisphaera sp. WC338 TaxID=3425129 RepID=UPI003D81B32B
MSYLPATSSPVKLILDTDMGNDIDDALALTMIHSLQSRQECELLGVTVCKDNVFAPQYVDLVNTFYGRGDIPIGMVQDGVTEDNGLYTRTIVEATDACGKRRYQCTQPKKKPYGAATDVLRMLLSQEDDQSVVIVMIGFSTNMQALLATESDVFSPLNGSALVREKVREFIVMAGEFSDHALSLQPVEAREYNIVKDIPAAQTFINRCPSPITFCGFEIGTQILFPADAIESGYAWVDHHPVREAYHAFREMPYDRPTWDLNAVLYAVRRDHQYFELSGPGKVEVDDLGNVSFEPNTNGKHAYLKVRESKKDRIAATQIELATQPYLIQPAIKPTFQPV